MANTVQLPGTQLGLDENVRIGPGLKRNHYDGSIHVTESGVVRGLNNLAWMEGARKRYIPVKGDLVLGVVTHKHPDYVRVDINAPELATLSAYAFESATKRNRVAINIGDLVFAKVSVALPDLEPEIVCCNMRTGKADGMGVIQTQKFSNSIVVNLQAARKALSPESVFGKAIGKHGPFEWCIGVNGRVLVTTQKMKMTTQICRIFPLITFLTNAQIEGLVDTALRP
ncbi:Oidioi.mRNA.OKI2018_I69.PAR.g9235.t1.cds [Oikopleura dioica]|uniref:Oidioi.mRNA.OKI2018_I69.PAR.g9235.t1.cds n=1 Tax=Oikopleura dioica TaxID=34765 RepID=A0ABN7RP34_OIKDI|nr:Oidioi.mRNA.OKI2018_I69.PAR.g9235.t1.cds [Oikopleura dioica]